MLWNCIGAASELHRSCFVFTSVFAHSWSIFCTFSRFISLDYYYFQEELKDAYWRYEFTYEGKIDDLRPSLEDVEKVGLNFEDDDFVDEFLEFFGCSYENMWYFDIHAEAVKFWQECESLLRIANAHVVPEHMYRIYSWAGETLLGFTGYSDDTMRRCIKKNEVEGKVRQRVTCGLFEA